MVKRILNQCVDQLGPKLAPTCVGVNSCDVASSKDGRSRLGTEYTASLTWSESETMAS